MSQPVAKKTVKIKENDLVDLIDGIVNEAVENKKQEWINEQAKKDANKTSLFESRLAAIEAKLAPKKEEKK
jgi:hypothetical protein